MNKKELGIYIHIPFCKQKCFYCDFTSFAGIEHMQDEYVKCLKKELKENLKKIDDEYIITTIFIGGGTPSYINSKYILEILKIIDNKVDDAEITIEVNPGTVTKEKLEDYKEAGINRLSIGLQSTNNYLLKEIGRIHNYEQFLETYNLARDVGFTNINVDLMLGLPDQRIGDLKDSLEKIIDLKPEHISVYSLILEEETALYNLVKKGLLELPDETLERQMYWYVKNTLELNGYIHYEISNFAKEGYESKHNTNCWKQKEYIGVGLGASSYLNNKRYSNIRDMDEYIDNINNNQPDKNKFIEEEQDDNIMQNEYMILGLRMLKGISIKEYKKKFKNNPIIIFKDKLENLVKEKLITIDGDNIKLTNKGLDLANIVWEEFI